MRRHFPILAAGLLPLAACAESETAQSTPPLPARAPEQLCDAAQAQEHIGHVASSASGAVLLQITGARQLRWVPPRTAVTMDYRPDRLTVSYDDDLVIERISCG